MTDSPSLEEKFRNNTLAWFELIGSMLDDLNAVGLTGYDSAPISSASAAISLMKGEKLIAYFIAGHDHWDKIANRDLKFVTEEIPKIYGKATIDVKAIVEPAKVYLAIKTKGNYKGSAKEDDWPVNSQDMERQWKYFDAMVNLSCRYGANRKNYPPRIPEDVDKHIKEIDFAKYGKLFNIKY
ncbi:Hypothetical protein POVR1_LOCUS407 [uncultured virus]|nr:Hypothetical protein POVR1_LOCUS407 [uncultured virus]